MDPLRLRFRVPFSLNVKHQISTILCAQWRLTSIWVVDEVKYVFIELLF